MVVQNANKQQNNREKKALRIKRYYNSRFHSRDARLRGPPTHIHTHARTRTQPSDVVKMDKHKHRQITKQINEQTNKKNTRERFEDIVSI